MAALVLATAPLQLQDAAEVNNYPLAIFGMAVLLAVARMSWGWFLIGVFVASWGHVLGLAAAGLLTAWRLWSPAHPGERVPVAAGAILIVAPLLIGIVSEGGSTTASPFIAQPSPLWMRSIYSEKRNRRGLHCPI